MNKNFMKKEEEPAIRSSPFAFKYKMRLCGLLRLEDVT